MLVSNDLVSHLAVKIGCWFLTVVLIANFVVDGGSGFETVVLVGNLVVEIGFWFQTVGYHENWNHVNKDP